MRVWSAPVRYAEADQQGIVFNAHYLTWADEAATAWFAALGTPFPALLERGLDVRVRASTLEWSSSARYGDVVDLDVRCERVGGSSLVLASTIEVDGDPRCTVRTTYVLVSTAVLVNTATRPVRIPEDLRAAWLSG